MATRSEDELGVKLDRCFADTLTKTVGGGIIGLIASVTLFKGRSTPAYALAMIGLGAGLNNCRHELQEPFRIHGRKVQNGVDAEVSF
uniref:MICOS complex subunit MIC10 n=1 Tax=Acrobeloides nanus TaxID=290746 RepID=A0A914BUA7_9BILA